MAEREQLPTSLAPAESSEGESVDVQRLPHLISGARESTGSDRRALALKINKLLIAMRSPGHAAAESQVLITALDTHALDGLIDAEHRSCRKEAVETLLACGFPHALSIAHEDLVFARAYEPGEDDDGTGEGWKRSLQRARRAGAAVVVGGELLFVMILAVTNPRMLLSPVTGSVIALLSGLTAAVLAVLFALQPPKVESQVPWTFALAACALAQLVSATAVGPPALLGGVGVVFGLLVSLSSQAEASTDPP